MRNKQEILKFAEFFGYTEETLNQAVERYHKTGKIESRPVAMMLGLTDD